MRKKCTRQTHIKQGQFSHTKYMFHTTLFVQQSDSGSSEASDNDEYEIRAAALGASEDLVLNYARKHGKTFQSALGALVRKRLVSKSSNNVRNLNFTDAGVRGQDIFRSILYIG